jgi:hypothetical protein
MTTTYKGINAGLWSPKNIGLMLPIRKTPTLHIIKHPTKIKKLRFSFFLSEMPLSYNKKYIKSIFFNTKQMRQISYRGHL